MNRLMMTVVAACGTLAAFGAADRLIEPAQGDVRLGGFAGAKIGRFIDHRVRSDFAKNEIFPSAPSTGTGTPQSRSRVTARG